MEDKKHASELKFKILRQQAEDLISRQAQAGRQGEPVDIRGLVHELEVHQIELEMQNEELVQTQVELEKSRDRYIDLYDFAPVGYLTLNEKGIILEANLTATSLLGVERKKLIRRRLASFVCGEDQDAFYLFSKNLFKTKTQQAGEVRLRQNGETIYVLLEGITTVEEGGELICRLSISNISKQKAVEQALAESEQRFRTMSDFTQDWEYWLDPEMNYVYISPSCEAISGYKPEEFRNDRGLLAKILYAPDREAWLKHETQVAQSNQGSSLDLRIVTRSGEVRWINHVCRPVFGAGGEWLGRRVSNRDITRRKQAEEALQENQANLESLLEYTTGIVWSIDRQYRMIAGNDRFRKNYLPVLGREIQPGESTLPVGLPEVYEEWRGYYERALAGETFKLESPTRAQADLSYLEYTFRPVYKASGEVSGVIVAGRDVTERKQTQAALEQSEERFAKAFFEAPIALSITRKSDGTFIEVNERFVQLFGFSRDELIGRTSVEAGFYPDRGARTNVNNELALGGYKNNMEIITATKAGVQLNVLISAVPVVMNNEVCNLGSSIDITDRRRAQVELEKAEERFAKAFYDAPVALSIQTRSEGRLVDVNESYMELFGYSRTELIGHTLAELGMNPKSEERAQYAAKMAADGFLRDVEMTRCTKAGETLKVLVSSVPLEMNDEECFLSTTLDITKRKKADEEREHLIGQLNAAQEQQQLLSARLMAAQENERRVIARELHDEIGQALTALKINLQTVQRKQNNALDLAESIAMVEHTLQQVRSISLNLPPTVLEDLGLAPALRWLLDRQGREAGFSTSFVSSLGDTRLNSQIEIAVFRVVQEALTNVMRHAHARQVSLKLEQSNQELHLTLLDDGKGYDVEAAYERAVLGNSLGLIGMQERVVLAGGRMEIESAPGKGTRIHASFPLEAPNNINEHDQGKPR